MPADQKGNALRRRVFLSLTLWLCVLCAFFPVLYGDFVWDDWIFRDSLAVASPSGLATIWLKPHGVSGEFHWWPVTYTSFWLEHKLWGWVPTGYHAVSLLLHFINSVLLWRVLLHLGVPGAWLAAAVWAVHPVHVESVAWIIERKGLLACLFSLSAALVWLRHDGKPPRGQYALALALFAAAMLSKSLAVSFPAALLVWHSWKHGQPSRAALGRLAPFFALGLGLVVFDGAFYGEDRDYSLDHSPVERVLLAARVLVFYAAVLGWPIDLPVIYPRWRVTAADPAGWLCLGAVVASFAALWFWRRRIGAGALAGAAFFTVALVPVLGFVDHAFALWSFIADRYQYLACIGLIAPAVGGAARIAKRHGRRAVFCGQGLAVVALVALAAFSWQQSAIWKKDLTLFSHIVRGNPDDWRAYCGLSGALLRAGRDKDALSSARAAERILMAAEAAKAEGRPVPWAFETDEVAWANTFSITGLALSELRQLDAAARYLQHAVDIDPHEANALSSMAISMFRHQRYGRALEYFRALAELRPDSAAAHHGIVMSLSGLGRGQEAKEHREWIGLPE